MQRLQDACRKNGPLCIGLDTDPTYIPQNILNSFSHPSLAVLAYNKALIDETKAYAGCYKVQIAYYEAMGLEGLKTYVETLAYLKKLNIPFISDIKRGDIADTARAYACAHFSGDFEADTITVNPYMGFDTLEPFLDWCKPASENTKSLNTTKLPKGFFVLLRTSNPGMVDIEKQALAKGGIVLDQVGEKLLAIEKEMKKVYEEKNQESKNSHEQNKLKESHTIDFCSPVGAVVGCTEESDARQLRDKYPNVFFLIPGYGAQGGAARIAATLLDKAGGAVNSSRGILMAWKKDTELSEKIQTNSLTMEDIVLSAKKAAQQSKEELLEAKASL